MPYLFVVQLALAATAISWGLMRLYALLFRTALDARVFLDALVDALEQGRDAATRLADCWPRAHVALLARCALAEPPREEGECDLLHAQLRSQAAAGIASLRTLGRMASPIALVAVILELGLAFQGGEGLTGLQKGLPERLAIEHSATAVTLGLCTSLFCFFSAAQLRSAARRRLAELRLTRDVIEDALLVRGET